MMKLHFVHALRIFFTQSTTKADATRVTSCLLMVRTDANVLAECTRKCKDPY